jgi:hypothetical protein
MICWDQNYKNCPVYITYSISFPKPKATTMYRDTSSCNSYNYGDAQYWNARYIQEGGSFDWCQRYTALRPFVRKYIPTSSRVLMVGCGNAGNFPFFFLAVIGF